MTTRRSAAAVALVLAAAGLAACADGGEGAGTPEDGATTEAPPASSPSDVDPEGGGDGAADAGADTGGDAGDDTGDVAGGELAAFEGWRELTVDDTTRRAWVHVPAGASDDAPVLVALHGRGGDVPLLLEQTGLVAATADRGVVLVAPEAVDLRWQVLEGNADVRLAEAAVFELRELGHVGAREFHLVGFSQGGSMAMRVASDVPDRIAGLVTVASQLPVGVVPSGPLPALVVYGAQDPLRPLEGLPVTGDGPDAPDPTVSAAATAAALAGATGADGPPLAGDVADGAVQRCHFAGGQDPVVLLVVRDGGHTWPGTTLATDEARFGPTSAAFDATAVALDFLLDGALPWAGPGASAEALDPACGT
ncbi:hypothetical protein FTX61_01255 [Nitriliruptoraceae bacterium ZYF776]|nr:hypothetical protein [Profundirhabdus halotolerans]